MCAPNLDEANMPLTPLQRLLINHYQGGIPLNGRPFSSIAARFDASEEQVIEAIDKLLAEGLLSRFGPLYNAERMGGGLVLAALEAPEDDYARVTEQVNALPEVAHNYRRDHRLNMWFVLATETPQALEQALQDIERETGLKVYAFPKLQEFYLGLWFQINADGSLETRPIVETELQPFDGLDALDRRIIALTQPGLPLLANPFQVAAEQAECAVEELLARFKRMLGNGVIRRIGLVPNHYKLGFHGNGMTVWNIPDERLEQVGRRLGALSNVSHCYARPRHLPLWPYNLFAMVHGKDRPAVLRQVERIAEQLAGEANAHEVLFSSAVLKKTGMRSSA
jgi:DNA-binding Lrp family transcriptional regulator